MKKKFIVFLLLLFSFSALGAGAEEDVVLFSMPTPAPAEQTSAPGAQEGEAGGEAEPEATYRPGSLQPDGSVLVTISALGDLTFGRDVRKSVDIFDREFKKQGNDLGFVTRNIRDLLMEDDLTLVNFETTLTTAPVFKKNNRFVFSAPPEYVDILTKGGIEAVSFENNHAMDHGQQGIDDTIATLKQAGIVYSMEDSMGLFETQGVRVGMLAYQTFNGNYPRLTEKVPQDILQARELCDILIVSYHWGAEEDYYPNENQQTLGRLTIDAGADLVVGHHSHRINPIEEYRGKYIVYSLANFSFAGNSKPSDMSSFVFQIRFAVKDGIADVRGFRIVPFRISSKTDRNDFIPTPFTDQRLIDNVINTMMQNGKKLAYHVDRYPVDWE